MPSRKGSPNRNKQFLLNRLQDMYGEDFHPIMKMAGNAYRLQGMADASDDPAKIKDANEAWDKVAQYTEPKLKAMEITAEVSQVDRDEVAGEVQQLLARRAAGDT